MRKRVCTRPADRIQMSTSKCQNYTLLKKKKKTPKNIHMRFLIHFNNAKLLFLSAPINLNSYSLFLCFSQIFLGYFPTIRAVRRGRRFGDLLKPKTRLN